MRALSLREMGRAAVLQPLSAQGRRGGRRSPDDMPELVDLEDVTPRHAPLGRRRRLREDDVRDLVGMAAMLPGRRRGLRLGGLHDMPMPDLVPLSDLESDYDTDSAPSLVSDELSDEYEEASCREATDLNQAGAEAQAASLSLLPAAASSDRMMPGAAGISGGQQVAMSTAAVTVVASLPDLGSYDIDIDSDFSDACSVSDSEDTADVQEATAMTTAAAPGPSVPPGLSSLTPTDLVFACVFPALAAAVGRSSEAALGSSRPGVQPLGSGASVGCLAVFDWTRSLLRCLLRRHRPDRRRVP